jgi:serine/threonine protein kinase
MLECSVKHKLSTPSHLGRDNFSSNDSSPRNRRLHQDLPHPAYAAVHRPPIATNFPPSTSPSSPSPSPGMHLPRSPYISARQVSTPNSSNKSFSRPSTISSVSSSTLENVLSPRDIVGEGCYLQGEPIRLVSIGEPPLDDEEPAREFEVISKLGTGSYAVVYEVCEVLSRPPPSDEGHMSVMGSMELDGRRSSFEYGRHYAIKCLSKANLDEDALAAQMSEVNIHQSLRSHPNIVTLHRTLETSSFLLLLLEFVPGEDLFYFLEQSRDHYESDSSSTDSSSSSSLTPPTPSLLSTLHPSQLLSRTRLRLIASMFSQMCDAVAACHAQQVYHRDIKPENFIVTDGQITLPNGTRERKVVVKLTDFGLSTRDTQSTDMDCGSAPYMSYECRNNVAPSYSPRAADVWSLGIVLINMLYHYNPWTDTTHKACASFGLYRQQPVDFFMQRFPGMTLPVAELLANKVFCILDDPSDDSARMDAGDFGAWAKGLPSLLGESSPHGHKRVVSNGSSHGYIMASSVPSSHRPSRCCTPIMWTPAMRSRSLSRTSTYERDSSDLSTVVDHDRQTLADEREEREELYSDGLNSRSVSMPKRPRKRGARRRKGSSVPPQSPAPPNDATLTNLATASQSLAREISRNSRSSSVRTSASRASERSRRDRWEPVSVYPLPSPLFSAKPAHATSAPPPVPSLPPQPTVVKKQSKWKLSFGKNSSIDKAHSSPTDENLSLPPLPSPPLEQRDQPQAFSTNVSKVLQDLDSPPSQARSDVDRWARGRRPRTELGNSNHSTDWIQPSEQATSSNRYIERSMDLRSISPVSTRSERERQQPASSASSTHSWRNSMSTTSSAMTSSSALTRFSNSSMRSVSTAATSASSSSWRAPKKQAPPAEYSHTAIPKNVKVMTSMPWELDELPRQQHANPVGDIFGSPPVRKPRTRKPQDLKLDTITERPQRSPLSQDASRSMTDLEEGDVDGQKKVQKGQINALAKMLSALRR